MIQSGGQLEPLLDSLALHSLDSLIRRVYWNRQLDSTLYYIEQQEVLARRLEIPEWRIRALQNRADLYFFTGDYLACIPANEALIAAYDSTRQFIALSDAHRNLAYALRKVNRSTASLQHYGQSIRYAELAGEPGKSSLAKALNGLGSFYLNRREYDLAKEKYQSSLAIHQAINSTQGLYSNLNNLGLVYAHTGDFETALTYYRQSLEMKQKAGDKRGMANTYGSIGDIYVEWGRRQEARQYFENALQLQQELGLRDESTRSLSQLGRLALLEGQAGQAVQLCRLACDIAEQDQLWQPGLDCYQCLYEAYKALGDFERALDQHERYTMLKDSMFNLQNTQEIAQWEARLQYQEKLAAAESEQTRLANAAEKERLWRWILLGALLAFGTLTWSVYSGSRLRKRQNQLLQEKNAKIAIDREIIQQQAEELAEVAEMKNQFFVNISHELRTPLTLVTGPLQKLLATDGDALPAAARSSLQIVNRNAGKLLDLVEELLELAQLEAGTAVVQEQQLSLPIFLHQLFDNYRPAAEDKSLSYHFHYTGDPVRLLTDVQRLQKIVNNLLGNAIKFTPADGSVEMRVKWEAKASQLRIQVQDTGPGIPITQQPYLFDRYFQADPQLGGGIGIGLALAQESARLMGGEISLQSEPDQGSIFTLQLPAKPAPSVALKAEPEQVPHLLDGTTANEPVNDQPILIVEDNIELQAFIREVLSPYPCSTANNGRAALQMLQQGILRKAPFQLVITDLMMPEVDGSQLVQQIKQDPGLAATRLVVLTAKQEVRAKLQMLRMGIDDYLTKPFLPEELLARVNKLLPARLADPPGEYPLMGDVPSQQRWLQSLEQVVNELLLSQKDLTASTVAAALYVSNRQLLRRIKVATNLSTQQYLQEARLQFVRQRLEQKLYHTVAEAAKVCGFNNVGYFSKVYTQRFGRRPSSYFD